MEYSLVFKDRLEAGEKLAAEVKAKLGAVKNALVLALPRGGVICGEQVAKVLNAPLDILLVRKLGAPFNEQLALGALVEGEPPHCYMNEELIKILKVDDTYLQKEKSEQDMELLRRQKAYRGNRARASIQGKTVILVDDGIATGASVRAGLLSLKRDRAEKVILAVPVAPPDLVEEIKSKREVDDVICLQAPANFRAVGQFYRDFRQVTDEEVKAALARV